MGYMKENILVVAIEDNLTIIAARNGYQFRCYSPRHRRDSLFSTGNAGGVAAALLKLSIYHFSTAGRRDNGAANS